MKRKPLLFQQLGFFDRLFPSRKRKETSSAGSAGLRRRPVKRQKKHDAPFLKAIWCEVRREYFPDRPDLDNYVVYWSNRNQKRTLASCFTEECRVIVARELDHPDVHPWLYPLLYHEMCHAYLGDNVPAMRNGKRAWHGKSFRDLEKRHPQMKAFDRWVKSGGWLSAVRSHRSRAAHARRKNAAHA